SARTRTRHRHYRRTVLRSRLRFRGDATLAHAARTFHPAWYVAGGTVVRRRLVGMDQHVLGDQLARSAVQRSAVAAVRADARRSVPVDVDPESIHHAWTGLRTRLRRHAAYPRRLHAVGAASPPPRQFP